MSFFVITIHYVNIVLTPTVHFLRFYVIGISQFFSLMYIGIKNIQYFAYVFACHIAYQNVLMKCVSQGYCEYSENAPVGEISSQLPNW